MLWDAIFFSHTCIYTYGAIFISQSCIDHRAIYCMGGGGGGTFTDTVTWLGMEK